MHSHQENQSAGQSGQLGVIQGILPLFFPMGRKDVHRCTVPSVCHRNAGTGRYGKGRRHPGNHLVGNPGGPQCFGLLSAAAKEKGIAALQAHHPFPFPGFFHQEPLDFSLREGVISCFFPHRDFFTGFRAKRQNRSAHQMIVSDHIRLSERLPSPHGKQAQIAGTGPYQCDASCSIHNPAAFLTSQASRLPSSSACVRGPRSVMRIFRSGCSFP